MIEGNNFSERLCTIRSMRGLTQQQLSEMTGIKRSTIANYETGYREPDIETVKKLAYCLNVSTDILTAFDAGKAASNYHPMRRASDLKKAPPNPNLNNNWEGRVG